jgi:hypothetical protein
MPTHIGAFDIVMVHAKALEEKFRVEEGAGRHADHRRQPRRIDS